MNKKFDPKITPGPWEKRTTLENKLGIRNKEGYFCLFPEISWFSTIESKKDFLGSVEAIAAVPELLEVYKAAKKLKGDKTKWAYDEEKNDSQIVLIFPYDWLKQENVTEKMTGRFETIYYLTSAEERHYIR